MGVEVDCRRLEEAGREEKSEAGYHVVRPRRGFELAAASSPVRRTNPYTGTGAYLDEPERGEPRGSLLDRALAHLLDRLPELDPHQVAPVHFAADPQVVETCSGDRIVHLRQHVHGVPVFRALRTVRFAREGELLDVVGDHVPCRSDEVDLVPTLDATGAVMAAARHLVAPDDGEGLPGLRISNRRGRLLGSFPLPGAPSLVHKLPFGSPIRVHQMLFFDRPRLRLAWSVHLWLPELFEQFDVLVAANGEAAGEILFCRSGISTSTVRARATYFNPDLVPPTLQELPQLLTAFPAFAPRPLPGPWVSARKTAGNNVEASWKSKTIAAVLAAGGDLEFDPAQWLELATVNAFFLCNYLHDFFYLLGFDEAAGALQRSNPAGIEGDRDPLALSIVGDVVAGDAKTATETDGFVVRLRMGQIASPDHPVARHTAFDAEVVFHEYAHAVTARRVGGGGIWKPLLHGPAQAQAMEEGLSDYFALTLQNHLRRRAGLAENLAYGAWSSGDPVRGRRPRSYEGFAGTFEGLASEDGSHERGMLWCAALLAVHRALVPVLGSAERADLAGWLLVFAAMPGIPIGQHQPSFLDGRDALITAATSWQASPPVVAEGTLGTPAEMAQIEGAVRTAFAGFGMGAGARSQAGTLAGLHDDFNP